jgi:PleD family two-component response regulator
MTMNMTQRTETKRILVVDDQARDTQLVKRFLEETNLYIVREENDANEAIYTAELLSELRENKKRTTSAPRRTHTT